jgi:hypothetical protein
MPASNVQAAIDWLNLAMNRQLTPYVVGGSESPYTKIQDAIDAARPTASFAAPALILVKPGTYTEDVNLFTHIHLAAVLTAKSYTTKINGDVTFTSEEAGSVGSQIATILGISISSSSGNPTLKVTGVNPCQLRISNCEVVSGSAAAALDFDNTGAGSMVVQENTNFVNSDGGYAVQLTHGKLAGFNGQTNALVNTNISVHAENAAQLELMSHYATGKFHLEGTSGGSIRGTSLIDAGAGPIITMDSTGTLLAAGLYALPGVVTPVDGTNVPGVVSVSPI